MRDERKGSSASVFEVANANGPNDLTRKKNVNSSLQLFADRRERKKKKKCSVFSIGRGLLHFYKMPSYQTCNKPPWFHLKIPSDISNDSEQRLVCFV